MSWGRHFNNRNDRGFYCELCDVQVFDAATFEGHMMGKQHIKRVHYEREMRYVGDYSIKTGRIVHETHYEYAQRLDKHRRFFRSRSRSGSLKRSRRYSDSEESSRGSNRGRRRRRSPFSDSDSYVDGRRSDWKHVKVLRSGEYECQECYKKAKTREGMDSHLAGKDHRRRVKKVVRYSCDLCHVTVTSEETLKQHFNGVDHVKRQQTRDINRSKQDEMTAVQLTANEMQELRQLRERSREQDAELTNLKREIKSLLNFKKYCLANHQNVETTGGSCYKVEDDIAA